MNPSCRPLRALVRDPLLAERLVRFGPPPDFRRPPGFPTLVRIVLEQGVSAASADAVYRRIRTGARVLDPEGLCTLGPAGIQAAGATAAKARCLDALAREVRSGALDLDALCALDDAEVVAALIRHPGIGPWTAQVYLLTALGRSDVWPDGDLALRRELARDGIRDGGARRERAARWVPFRSTAAFVLWHAYLVRRARSPQPLRAGTPQVETPEAPSASPGTIRRGGPLGSRAGG